MVQRTYGRDKKEGLSWWEKNSFLFFVHYLRSHKPQKESSSNENKKNDKSRSERNLHFASINNKQFENLSPLKG